MNASRILLASLAVAALLALPGSAPAESLVPPGNSAANQYTETFPTAGGNAEAKGKGKVTPGDVLGSGNAKKLDSQGKQGREAAAVVTATAPPPAVGSAGGDDGESGGGSGGSSGAGGANDNGGGSGGGKAAGGKSAAGGGSGAASGAATVADSEGSSGFGEVLGQATGSSSSGGIGLLLPLVVLASVAWAVAFFLRRRRRTA